MSKKKTDDIDEYNARIDAENAQIDEENAQIDARNKARSALLDALKPFDLRTEWEAEVKPLVDALFEKCKALNLPVLIVTEMLAESTPTTPRTHANVVICLPEGRTSPLMAHLRHLTTDSEPA